MTCFFKISFIGIILLILSAGLVHSQDQKYRFRHLTTDDGLPANYCYSVIKDPQGFIWIATRGGLCRYDGYNMKVYQYDPADSTSISDNSLGGTKCMVIDHSGNLWISTYRNLNRYDAVTGAFKRYQYDPEDPGSIGSDWIYCLFIDKSGTLWVGTGNQGGLNRYLSEKDQFIGYTQNLGDTSREIPSIFSIYEDRFGIFWVGTADGLYQFDRERETFRLIKYTQKLTDPANPILYKYINEDIDGTLFIGTQFGYLTYDRSEDKLIPFEPLYNENESFISLDILPELGNENKMLWIIAWKLYQFDRQTKSLTLFPHDPEDPLSIRGELMYSIFRDETGMIWIPSEICVNIMDPNQNQVEKYLDFSDRSFEPKTFLEDYQGHLWIGSFNLLEFDKEMNLVKQYAYMQDKDEEKSINYIIRIFEDSEKNIWLGMDTKGLYLLDRDKNELVRCAQSPLDIVVTCDIMEDSAGILWLGTDLGLFQHKRGDNPLTDFHQDSTWGLLSKSQILCIKEDRSGNLWFGTNFNGLFCQPPEYRGTSTFIRYTHDSGNDNSLSNDCVWSVYEDKFNDLWIATEHGLNKFIKEENQFKRYISNADLGANFIYDLTGDNKGYLWMTTESGLIRFNPVVSDANAKTTNRFKQILPFKEIFPYRIYKNKTGKLFIGTPYVSGKGYFSFYPDSMKENIHIPPVVLIDFKLHNSPFKFDTNITLKKHLSLKYNQNFFSFEFAALDYAQPEKNQYAYYLEGLEDDWIYSGDDRTANYTKVLPGNYVFHVKGSNNDGYWNEDGTSISITILPPPWNSWWAYILYGFSIIGTGYLIIRFYLKRLQLSHRLELEYVEAQKLKELDRMKSRFFTNVSHEFRTPLTLILGPMESLLSRTSDPTSKQELNIIQRNALRLQRLINQLLGLSKIEAGQMKLNAREENLVSFVKGYIQSFESAARQKGVELTFASDHQNISVYIDHDKMGKILYNLLSNALKFTGEGGRIKVAVSGQQSAVGSQLTADRRLPTADLPDNCVIISIQDTGSGISPENLPHIFDRFYQADDSDSRFQEGTGIGLALAKELVELHHGKIEVESTPGKGTTFTIYLPLGKDHLKEDDILPEKIKQDFITAETAIVLEEEKFVVGKEKPITKEVLTSKVKRPVLLLVEDNSDMRYYIRSFIEGPYHLVEADNGMDGWNTAINQIPDLVISDIMMPGMDGYELCMKLKKDERTSHIPVVLLTAKAAMKDKLEGLETGADEFITKPFQPMELMMRVKNLIRQRQMLREKFRKEFEHITLVPEHTMSPIETSFMDKARKVIGENMSNPDFDILEFSSRMNMSRVQLHRKLSALFNLSASAFIRTYRLNAAARLFESKAGNVAQIAFEVGFNNLSYFSKCFQQQFGIKPSEYINRQ